MGNLKYFVGVGVILFVTLGIWCSPTPPAMALSPESGWQLAEEGGKPGNGKITEVSTNWEREKEESKGKGFPALYNKDGGLRGGLRSGTRKVAKEGAIKPAGGGGIIGKMGSLLPKAGDGKSGGDTNINDDKDKKADKKKKKKKTPLEKAEVKAKKLEKKAKAAEEKAKKLEKAAEDNLSAWGAEVNASKAKAHAKSLIKKANKNRAKANKARAKANNTKIGTKARKDAERRARNAEDDARRAHAEAIAARRLAKSLIAKAKKERIESDFRWGTVYRNRERADAARKAADDARRRAQRLRDKQEEEK